MGSFVKTGSSESVFSCVTGIRVDPSRDVSLAGAMSFKNIARLILTAGLLCSLSCKDSGSGTSSTIAGGAAPSEIAADEQSTALGVEKETDESATEVPKGEVNQDKINALLSEIPKDALFAMVVQDMDVLHDAQIEGFTWKSNLERLKKFLPSENEDEILGSEVAQGRLLMKLLESSKDGMSLWVHPDSIELVSAQLEANQIVVRYAGWGLGQFLGVMLENGFDSDVDEDDLPFDDLAEQIAERVRNSDRAFGITFSMPETGVIAEADRETFFEDFLFEEGVNRIKFEAAGVKWAGVEWSLPEEGEEDGMVFGFDPTGSEALQSAVLSRKPVLVAGEKDGRQVWFWGTRNGIEFGKSEEESLLAVGEVRKVLDHCPVSPAVLAMTRPILPNTNQRLGQVFPVFAEEYVDRVVEGNLFPDRRVLSVLADRVRELDEANLRLCGKPIISVVYEDDGIVYEQHGGPRVFGVDYETQQVPVDASALADDTWLILQGRSDPKAKDLTRERFALLASLIDMPLASLKGRERDEMLEEQVGPVLDIYYSTYREALLDAWTSLGRLSKEGLEDEWILVADAQGAYPQVPDWPEALIEEAAAPRIAYSAPVKNREAISQSWSQFTKALDRSVIKTGEVFDLDFTMPKPLSDEGDHGIKNYYYAIPLTSNECLPCLSLNDSAFAVGTSKKINQAVIRAWSDRNEASEPFTGLRASLRIKPLRQLIEDLVEHGGLMDPDEEMNDDFEGEFEEFDDLDPDDEDSEDEPKNEEVTPSEIYQNFLKGTEAYESIEMSHFLKDGEVITRIVLRKVKAS